MGRSSLAVVGLWAAPLVRNRAYDTYVQMLTAPGPAEPIVETMVRSLRLGRVPWGDLVLATVLLVAGAFGTGPASAKQHTAAGPLAYALIGVACLAIAVWRVRPLWTFVITGGATLLYLLLGYAYGPILFATAVAVFGFTSRSPLRRTLIAMGTLLLASAAVIGIGVAAGTRGWTEFISMSAWLVIPAAVGIAVKVRRDAMVDVRAAQARRAVSEERLQLAQEVHDVAGHGFSVIAMQAGVALRVLDRDLAAARAALEGIRATSRDALASLRAEIEALQQGAAGPLRPDLGLADLPALAGRIRSSGLPVTVEGGPPEELPAVVDRAAYRIVQESLTNVLRHAGADATARVKIRQEASTLVIEVTDTGRGTTETVRSGGRGLDGMRSRAAALGGTFAAGPSPAGGFAIHARLPLAGHTTVEGEL
jgi:signal transduction histidine kinase